MRIIASDADVHAGAMWLVGQDHRWANALAVTQPLPLRRKPDGFAELLSAIVGQQVSTQSAAAIWARLREAGLTAPETVSAAPEATLRTLGLSRQKIRYAKALADTPLDYDALRDLSSAEVVKTLTHVPGIGTWTAEIYAKFSLGHADVFACGDLALQEGARLLFDLPERPNERQLRRIAEAWSPWRAVAARILWAYYRVRKQREGIR